MENACRRSNLLTQLVPRPPACLRDGLWGTGLSTGCHGVQTRVGSLGEEGQACEQPPRRQASGPPQGGWLGVCPLSPRRQAVSTQPASTMTKKRCVLGTALLRGQRPGPRSWRPPPPHSATICLQPQGPEVDSRGVFTNLTQRVTHTQVQTHSSARHPPPRPPPETSVSTCGLALQSVTQAVVWLARLTPQLCRGAGGGN